MQCADRVLAPLVACGAGRCIEAVCGTRTIGATAEGRGPRSDREGIFDVLVIHRRVYRTCTVM